MTLLEQIRGDRMEARLPSRGTQSDELRRLKVSLLTTLVGEAETALKGKQAKKFDMQKLVQKFVSNLKESLNIKYTADQHQELQILEKYLPKQLTRADIEGIIRLQSPKSIGQFMGYMGTNFRGQFDGKVASAVFKQITQE